MPRRCRFETQWQHSVRIECRHDTICLACLGPQCLPSGLQPDSPAIPTQGLTRVRETDLEELLWHRSGLRFRSASNPPHFTELKKNMKTAFVIPWNRDYINLTMYYQPTTRTIRCARRCAHCLPRSVGRSMALLT